MQVRNTGRVVDQFTVQPLGQPAAGPRSTRPPCGCCPTRRVPPASGSSRRARPRCTPGGSPTACSHLQGRPGEDGAHRVEPGAEPFGDIEAELIPRTSEGRRIGEQAGGHQRPQRAGGGPPGGRRPRSAAADRGTTSSSCPCRPLGVGAGRSAPGGCGCSGSRSPTPSRRRSPGSTRKAGGAAPTTVDGSMLQARCRPGPSRLLPPC